MGSKGVWTCTKCGDILSRKLEERNKHKCKKIMVQVADLEKYDAEMCEMVTKLNGLLGYLHVLQETFEKVSCCACTKEVEGATKPVNVVTDEHLETCPFYILRHPEKRTAPAEVPI